MDTSVAVIKVRERPPKVKEEEQTENNPVSDDTTKDASYWNSLDGIVILGACAFDTSVMALVPRQNSILYPEYWYEILFGVIVSISSQQSVSHIVTLFIFTKKHTLLTMAHFAKVFSVCLSFWAIPYCCSYVIWTLYMGYNHPMPFVGMFTIAGNLGINMVAFWFLFPSELRSKKELKRQATVYLIYRIWIFLQNFVKEIMSFVATTHLQWALVLVIPSAKILSTWVAKKIVAKFPETNNEDVKFLVTAELTKIYTTYVTARLSSLNQSSVYGILIAEVVIHMIGCYQIIKLNNHVEEDGNLGQNYQIISYRKLKVQNLVMSEFVDAIMPLAHGIAFSMAYYGPNAALMRNIGNAYFGGKIITDVQRHYLVMVLMFAFDIFAMVISGASLKYFSNIDLFQAFSNMMKNYWIIFLVKLPGLASSFAAKDVNSGIDFSMKHLWITDEGRLRLIRDAVELSVEEKTLLQANSTLW